MGARRSVAAGLLTMAVAIAGGCESAPTALDQDRLPAALLVPAGALYQVTVCKDGPENRTYSFGITTQQDWINLPFGNSFTLEKDECKLVATSSTSSRFVDVVEYTPPAGTMFWKVELWNYGTLSGGGQSLKSTSYSNAPIRVGPFGGDNGWVVVYYNVLAPSADCTLTQGYWTNHEVAWPVSSLMLGDVSYTKAQLLAILGQPVKGNGLVSMSHQLIAAKLNILAGADGSAVAAVIAQADAMIGASVGDRSVPRPVFFFRN